MSHPRLDGRVTLVTGGAGDIGRAVAVRAAAEGAAIVLTDLPAAGDRLDDAARACRDAGAPAVHTVGMDVTDEEAVTAAVAEATEVVGVPDGLVTSAGVQGAFAPALEQSPADIRTVLLVNVLGTILPMQACARALAEAGRTSASFVALASMAGVSGAPNMLGYSASKAAVLGVVRSAALDLAPLGIRVNAVSPAFIGPGAMWDRQVELQARTPSQYYADTPVEVAEQMIRMVPLRRYGSLEEVAAVVAFLLSDDAGYVNGTNLPVSGGSP